MKRYIVKIAIFAISVVVVDLLFGFVCDYLNSHARGGDTRSHYYVAKQCNEDILVFGSSRAVHHYYPQILSDSLGCSVYNAGVQGEGILYFYNSLLTIIDRYNPKMIIYDIEAWYDLGTDDYTRYLGWMKRYSDTPGAMEVFDDVNPYERWKLKSSMYRYNGTITKLMIEYMRPVEEVQPDGFKPVYGELREDVKTTDREAIPFDSLKEKYFVKLINLCRQRNIQLVFAYSPTYGAKSSRVFSNMTDFCAMHDITLLDYNCDPEISTAGKLFADVSHMNVDGAKVFTSKFASKIKTIYRNN